MTNNTKMITTNPETIDLLSKIKGWHLLRENKTSYTDIVKNLVFQDAKRKGLLKNNGNNQQKGENEKANNEVGEVK